MKKKKILGNILQANKQSISVIGKKLKDYFVNNFSTSTTCHLKISIMLNPTSLMPPLAFMQSPSFSSHLILPLLPPLTSLVNMFHPWLKKLEQSKNWKKGMVFTSWTDGFYSWTTDFYQTSWEFDSWLNHSVRSCF